MLPWPGPTPALRGQEGGREWERPPFSSFSHCHGNPSSSPAEMKLLAPWLKPPSSCNVGERALNRQPGRPGLSSGFATWQSPSAVNSTLASWLLGLKSLALSSAPLSVTTRSKPSRYLGAPTSKVLPEPDHSPASTVTNTHRHHRPLPSPVQLPCLPTSALIP